MRAENDKLRAWAKEVRTALAAKSSPAAPAAVAAPDETRPPAARVALFERDEPTAATHVAAARPAHDADLDADAAFDRSLDLRAAHELDAAALADGFVTALTWAAQYCECMIELSHAQDRLIASQATQIAELRAQLKSSRRRDRVDAVPDGPPLPTRARHERPSQLVDSLRALNKRLGSPT